MGLSGNEFRETLSVLYELSNLEILDVSQNKLKILQIIQQQQQDKNIFYYFNKKKLKVLSLKIIELNLL